MYLSGESILIILVVGLIAGWLAGKVVQGTGYGLIGDIVIGIIGAFIASWLFPRLGIALGAGLVREIIDATIGAILLLVILRLRRIQIIVPSVDNCLASETFGENAKRTLLAS